MFPAPDLVPGPVQLYGGVSIHGMRRQDAVEAGWPPAVDGRARFACMAAVTALLSCIPGLPFAGDGAVSALLLTGYALFVFAYLQLRKKEVRSRLRRMAAPLAAGLTVLLLCGELTGSAVRMLRDWMGSSAFRTGRTTPPSAGGVRPFWGALDTVAEEGGALPGGECDRPQL